MRRKNFLSDFQVKPTVQLEVSSEGLFDFLSFLGKKKKEPSTPGLSDAQLKANLLSAINKTYANLTWVQDNIKSVQHLPDELKKQLKLKGVIFDTPLQTLQEGFKIEKDFISKYAKPLIDLDKKASDIQHELEESITGDTSTVTTEDVQKLLHGFAQRAKSLKMVFDKSFVGPECFGGSSLCYADMALEASEDSAVTAVTSQDVVAAAQFICKYWLELSDHKSFIDDLKSNPFDYHIYKWTSNLGVEDNEDLETLYSFFGEGGSFTHQAAFFEKQLGKMEQLVVNVGRWLHHATSD